MPPTLPKAPSIEALQADQDTLWVILPSLSAPRSPSTPLTNLTVEAQRAFFPVIACVS